MYRRKKTESIPSARHTANVESERIRDAFVSAQRHALAEAAVVVQARPSAKRLRETPRLSQCMLTCRRIRTLGCGCVGDARTIAEGPDILTAIDAQLAVDDNAASFVEREPELSKDRIRHDTGSPDDRLRRNLETCRSPARRQQFVAAFSKKFGAEPTRYALAAAQAMDVLLDAIAHSDGSRASVTRNLFTIRFSNGILGSFWITPTGDTTLDAVAIYRIIGGKVTTLTTVVVPDALVASD